MITKKKRTRFTMRPQQVPQFQYREYNLENLNWIDTPWFILTVGEARAYVSGKGIYRYTLRELTAYREGGN